MVAEVGATGQVLEISFAKSLQSSHRVSANRQAATSYPNQEVHLLQVCFSVSHGLFQLTSGLFIDHDVQADVSC